MASKNIVEIVIKATDQASKKMKGLDGVFKKLGVAAAATGVAVAAMGVAAGVAIFKMTKEAASVEKLSKTFDTLAKSIGESSDVMIKDLRVASRGMVNDAQLMANTNRLLAMGLADTADETARITEMSTQLGSAMGMTATESMEKFNMMLANQSIRVLDSFGISVGDVRTRIEELMEANVGMTREAAFAAATLEVGGKTMEKVGEQGEGAAASMARLTAKVDNLKIEIGKRFLPILEVLTNKLLKMWDDPKIQNAIDTLLLWIEGVADEIVKIVDYLAAGNVEAAFDTAFGEGAYTAVMKVVDSVQTLIDWIGIAVEGLNKLKVLEGKYVPVGTGFSRMFGTPVSPEFGGSPVSSSSTTGWGSSAATSPWRRASGGPVSAGGSYLVGERGPEMLTMGGDGYVTPNNKLGGITVHLHMNSAVSLADRSEAERVLLPFIEKGLRTVMAR